MDIKLEDLPYEELMNMKRRVDDALETFEFRKGKEAWEEATAVAKKYGFKGIDELLQYADARRSPVAAKYKNPEDASATWTGRGRKPRWVAEALESGKTLEDLAI